MAKKLLCLLLLVSIAVFVVGLLLPGYSVDGSFSYDALKIFIESISGNSESIMFDVSMIRVLQLYLTNFDFDSTQKIIFVRQTPNPGEWLYTDIIIQTISEDGSTENLNILHGLHLSVDSYKGLVSVLGWLDHEPVNGNVLKTVFLIVKTFVGFLVAFCFILVYLILDIVAMLWSILYGFMKLFGWVT